MFEGYLEYDSLTIFYWYTNIEFPGTKKIF